ncbi:ribonuclease P protein component [Angustibacter speluncae]
MLPARHRLVRGEHFAQAIRHGVRSGRRRLVVHVAVRQAAPDDRHADQVPLVGFVVSKAVGGSVVRNRVQRRLRHLMRPLLPELPAGALVVVRALPPAATSTSAELDADLRPALERCLRHAAARP